MLLKWRDVRLCMGLSMNAVGRGRGCNRCMARSVCHRGVDLAGSSITRCVVI